MRYSYRFLLVALSLGVAPSPGFAQSSPASMPGPGSPWPGVKSRPALQHVPGPRPNAGRDALLTPVTSGRRVLDNQDRPPALNRAAAVGIMTGGLGGTFLQIGSDLSAVVTTDKLRVMPFVGRGSVQNLGDLLYFHGVDLALLAADSVREAESQKLYPGFRRRVDYIAKLYDEEIHVLAGPDVHAFADLAGKTVNLGAVGAGTAVTAPALFDAYKISVNPTYESSVVALEKLKQGEIAAMMVVNGKPSQLIAAIPAGSGLHLLSLPASEALSDVYVPAKFTHADYPALTAEDETVETWAVPVLLTAYNWPARSPRYRNLAAFTDFFFSHLTELHQMPYHEKWHEVNLRARVPGWTRAPYAQQWLDRSVPHDAAALPVPVATGFLPEEFNEWTSGIGLTQLTAVQRTELFRLWKSRRLQAQE